MFAPPIEAQAPKQLQRWANTWLHWDSKKLFEYEKERPDDYEDLKKDAADLVKKIEWQCGWEGEFPHPKDRKIYEMVLMNKDNERRGYCIHGDTLELEDMKRPVVRKFFMRSVDEAFLITNRGEELPLNFTIDNNVQSMPPQLVAQLRYSGNQAKPVDEHEAFEMAQLNRMVYDGFAGTKTWWSPYGFLHLWKSLPSDRMAEDALLYLNKEVNPNERPHLAKHLWRWAAEADEDSGLWLGKRIIRGNLSSGGTNRRIYDALMLDQDFRSFMTERF